MSKADAKKALEQTRNAAKANALIYAARNSLVDTDILTIPTPPLAIERYTNQEDCDALGTTPWSYYEFDQESCTCFFIDDIDVTDEHCVEDFGQAKPYANPFFH